MQSPSPAPKFALAALTLAGASLFAQTPNGIAPPTPKLTPGFDVGAIDRAADPCTDFFQYSCGTWLKNNPVPGDQARWGRFDELFERNRQILRGVLEKAAQPSATRSETEQKIGDYYASCMDEAGIEKKGLDPLRPVLHRILRMEKSDLTEIVTQLHRSAVDVLFAFRSEQDAKDATEVIAAVDQGGLGLPDRDYYFKDDAKSVETRKKYEAHIQRMFTLAGLDADDAARRAAGVLAFETTLAKGALDNVSRRDPNKVYHRMPVAELKKLAPAFNWDAYLKAVGAPAIQSLNVAEPEFMKAMNTAVETAKPDDLKAYLGWQALRDAAPLLSKRFVDENFDFYRRTLRGTKEQQPRWKRCVTYVDAHLGEALGKAYVEQAFPPSARQRMAELVAALEKALEKDIQQLPWMTADTKKQAMVKLEAIANKVGHPEKFRDYDGVRIARGEFLGNAERASTFEVVRNLQKIGRPVDKKEWFMTPPTVNAYYDPQNNNINFPAGILQPPFFDVTLDDAVNFGAIGAVIGHELTHGFDDQGRQFDAKGNLRDWWTEADGKEFTRRAECFVQQYSKFTAVDDVTVNGKLTLGENVADNGGIRIAYMALMDSLTSSQKEKVIDGFTPAQRFFLGWGQAWCSNQTPEAARLQALTDPHSPGKFRVNGVVQNSPEFREAFACKLDTPMVVKDACRVW